MSTLHRSATEADIADLAGLFGWRHHHSTPSAIDPDGFPSELLLRDGRLVLVTIAGSRAGVSRPEAVWISELRATRTVEALVVQRDDLCDLTRTLRRGDDEQQGSFRCLP